MNKKILIGVTSAIFVCLFIAAKFFFQTSEKEHLSFLANENSKVFVRDYSPRLGEASAPVYLVEFLDPECESCRSFYPEVKRILSMYTGKVQLVVRYAPFHGNSVFAIKILEAARKQGKYWETMEMLFHYQPIWGDHHSPRPELIWSYLPGLDLDIDRLKKDMEDPAIEGMIAQEISDAKELNVRGTPTFFVNGKPLERFGVAYLIEAIEKELR
jgi:protein-disulfide isomerase